MRPTLKRLFGGVAALTLGATLVPFLPGTASASDTPGRTTDPEAGPMPDPVLNPSTIPNQSTGWAFQVPVGTHCNGSGADGWRIQTFIVNDGVDLSTLNFTGANSGSQGYVGADWDGRDGTIEAPLYKGSAPSVNMLPAVSPPGQINPSDLSGFNFDPSVFPGFADGVYQIGFACTAPGQVLDQWWSNRVTIDGDASSGTFMAAGVVDEAPVLDSVTPGDATLTANFTHTPSDAANTTYTATATPTGGGTEVTETGTGSPIVIGGLTNGTEYSVTVGASNLAGDSPQSNAIAGTPVPGAQPAVENLTATPDPTADSGIVNLDWDPPVGGDSTPTGYEVTVDPAGGAVTVDDVNTSAQVTGLTPGTPYTFTVTPLHPDPFVGTPASVEATPVASGVTILEQNVTVTRPAGALVFTQRCEDSSTGTPLPEAAFGNAPCAIAFGEATFTVPGGGAQPFFEAAASLNNVQVESTGDDNGWTVTGDMSEFVAGPAENQRFSGDQLGWTPLEASATDGLTVNLGPAVPPGTVGGMSASPTLASSPTPGSLGIAELDADLELVIPVQKRAGEYQGTLTMTATPGV